LLYLAVIYSFLGWIKMKRFPYFTVFWPASDILQHKHKGGIESMLKAERRAEVEWQGSLIQGSGRLVSVGSGAIGNLPITWASRTERSDGKTSPEELMAAAHAACYAMAFSHALAQAGNPAERLTVDATCTFEQVEGGFKISTMALDVHGKVPGLDQAGFEKFAQQAEQGCPVSNALRNNVAISVNAHLES
jgi:osmotically inducible protein OsmC